MDVDGDTLDGKSQDNNVVQNSFVTQNTIMGDSGVTGFGQISMDIKSPQVNQISSPKGASQRNTQSMEHMAPSSENNYNILPDCCGENLDILIVGINPGYHSAITKHHYAGPTNHFWKCLFLSGLIDEELSASHDIILPSKYGIGLTNLCTRVTTSSSELTGAELRTGARRLLKRLTDWKPKIIAFNGMTAWRAFARHALRLPAAFADTAASIYGRQPDFLTGTILYAMPSSSARCAHFPTPEDKVSFYYSLKQLIDQVKAGNVKKEPLHSQATKPLQPAKPTAVNNLQEILQMQQQLQSLQSMQNLQNQQQQNQLELNALVQLAMGSGMGNNQLGMMNFNDPMLLAASNGLSNIGVDDNNSPLNQLINVQLQHAQAMQQINQLAMLQGQQNTQVNNDLNQLQQLLQLQSVFNGQLNQNNVLGSLNLPFVGQQQNKPIPDLLNMNSNDELLNSLLQLQQLQAENQNFELKPTTTTPVLDLKTNDVVKSKTSEQLDQIEKTTENKRRRHSDSVMEREKLSRVRKWIQEQDFLKYPP